MTQTAVFPDITHNTEQAYRLSKVV